MKRSLTAILLILLILTTGCAGKTETPEVTDEVNKDGQIVIKLGLFSSSTEQYGLLNWFPGAPISGLNIYSSAYRYIKDAAYLFSLDNKTYDIEIIDYGSYGGDDYINGLDRLNTDIMTGNMPDMLLLCGMPYESYAHKGLFVDLYSYINTDELFPGLLSAMETDGRLYFISPENIAYTWFGLSSVIGSGEVTFSQMRALLKQAKADGAAFFNDDYLDRSLTGEELFGILYTGQRKNLINESEGTCSFRTQDFYDMLDLCRELGSTIKETEKDALAESLTVYGELFFGALSVTVRDYFQLFQLITGERDINITGVPGSGDLLCVMQLPLAVSAQSPELTKVGACEFINAMINRQYSSRPDYLPLSQKEYEKRLNSDFIYIKAWEDGTEQTEQFIPIKIDGKQENIKLPDFTKQDYNLMVELINSATIPYYAQAPEMEIVNSEVAAFLTGDISSQQCAEKIQQRLSIYLAEQK